MSANNCKMSTVKMKAIFSAAFERLSPLCVNITKNCTTTDLDTLESCINDLDAESIDMLQDYLLFPFRLLLCKKEKENLMIKAVNCMTSLFTRISISSWSTFSDIFLLLFSLISVPGDVNKICVASEEMKISVCECIFELIKNSKEEILSQIFSSSFRLPLAQAFYVLLEMLKCEKSKFLQKTILQAIGVLTYSPRYHKILSKEIEALAEICLVAYLPGLSISLSQIICGNHTHGHSVIVLALSSFSDVLSLVIKDSCVATSPQDINLSKSDLNTAYEIPHVVRNAAWVKEVTGYLEILIRNITAVISNHEHWKVRLAYLEFVRDVIYHCSNNLSNCFSVLLRAVFALSVDNYKQVELRSNEVILQFSQMICKQNSKTWLSIIEDDIVTLTSQLVRITFACNDAQKLSVLKTLQGYLTLLSPSLSSFLYSAPYLKRLILSLLNLTEFDCSFVNLMEEVSMSSKFDLNTPNLWPKKHFKFFEDEEIAKRVASICGILCSNRNVRLVIDYLMEKFKYCNEYTLQSTFLLINLIKSFSKKFISQQPAISTESSSYVEISTQNIELISDILSDMLSSEIWDLCNSSTTKSLNNVFQICLILELVAVSAEVLKLNFKKTLITILCPVMEMAGAVNLVISQSGKVCLHSIAVFCGFDTISNLIKGNSDYIVNSILINFHQFLHKPEASLVLRVAFEESDADVLMLFKDPIFRVFKVLDYNQQSAFSLFQILMAVVKAICKWYLSNNMQGLHDKKCEAKSSLRTALLQHHHLRKIEMSYTEEPSEEVSDTQEDVAEQTERDIVEKKEIPLRVEIVTEILTRCIHFQSSKDLALRVLTLEVMRLSVLALADFNEELLPLVHNLWNPFVERFSENTTVSMQAFETLLVIANECSDFIRARTLKDIFPKLINFLDKQRSISASKSNFKNYKCTTVYKFQECILAGIGYLASKIRVSEKDVSILASTCLPYLSDKQPAPLRQAAAKSVQSLFEIDADALWLYHNELYSDDKVLLSSEESLCNIHFPFSNNSDCSIKFNF